MNRITRFAMMAGLLAIFGVLMTACAPQTVNVEVTRLVEGPAGETIVVTEIVQVTAPAPETTPQRLVVYSGRSETLVGPIISQFAEISGIQVDVRYGNTSEIAATILEEGQNSPADVFFAQDPGGLGAVAQAGFFTPLPQETLDQVDPFFRSPDGLWVGVSGRARVVVYNTDAITDPENQLPEDIFDFIDPQWNGRIGYAPTNGSFIAMVTTMRQVWGDEQTTEWLQGIQANNPVVFEGNTPIVEAVARGEVEVGFVNHYYLYRFLAEQGEGFGARNYFLPSSGPGSLIMLAGVGQLATSSNPENAQKFIDFLLSPIAQQYFASQTNEYPLVAGVRTAPGLPSLDSLRELAIDVDMADLADLQGTVALMQAAGVLP